MTSKHIVARLSIDTTQVQHQAAEMSALLEKIPEARRQHFLGLFFEYFDRLGTDHGEVVLGEDVATPRADGSIEVLHRLRLGAGFELLMSALRTGEIDA